MKLNFMIDYQLLKIENPFIIYHKLKTKDMNENIDLTKILKDCPIGWDLYSPICGFCKFDGFDFTYKTSVQVIRTDGRVLFRFTKEGYLYCEYNHDVECVLFPSKDQRDWSKFTAPWYKKEKFDPKTLKAFDKVLVRDNIKNPWVCDHFSYINHANICITIDRCKYCIPYNDDTKHLVGTTNDAPEYYKYWEDKLY